VDVGACEVEMFYTGVDESAVYNQQLTVTIYPNPFSHHTTFEFGLEQPGEIALTIYNNQGQEVAVLVNEHQDKGRHHVQWNAEEIPSGIYFYRLAVSGQRSAVSGKMVKY